MNYIFVPAVDNVERHEWARIGIESIRRYADRVGAILILHRERGNLFPTRLEDGTASRYDDRKSLMFQKFECLRLDGNVLLLDCDIIVKPTCPNLFDYDRHMAFYESECTFKIPEASAMARLWIAMGQSFFGEKPYGGLERRFIQIGTKAFGKTYGWTARRWLALHSQIRRFMSDVALPKYEYFNAGVQYIPQDVITLFRQRREEVINEITNPNIWEYLVGDQEIWPIYLIKWNVPRERWDCRFNYIIGYEDQFPIPREEAYILHYPGNNKDQLVRDWKALGLE